MKILVNIFHLGKKILRADLIPQYPQPSKLTKKEKDPEEVSEVNNIVSDVSGTI